MLNFESFAVPGSVDLIEPLQTAAAVTVRAQAAQRSLRQPHPRTGQLQSGQPRPSLVWRSQTKPMPWGPQQPAGLYLVPPGSGHRSGKRRKGTGVHEMRTHLVEGAYLVASLGTALAIWWGVR